MTFPLSTQRVVFLKKLECFMIPFHLHLMSARTFGSFPLSLHINSPAFAQRSTHMVCYLGGAASIVASHVSGAARK